jgi:long-chain acyl-CoA synthetase
MEERELISSQRTLPRALEESVRAFADRPALSMVNGTPLTYGVLAARVRGAAALLAARGVRAGDRVAILSENMPQWGIAYFAVTSMGAVAVPIMTEFQAVQIAHIMTHSECRAILASARLRDKAAQAAPELPAIPIESLADAADAPVVFPAVAESDLAEIIYTSGTTGHSKGVMLTHANIVFDAGATESIVNVRPTDRLLSILTLAHTYECTLGLVAALMRGASVYYLDRPPSATALIPALQAVRPTIVLSVPLVIEKIYRSKVQPELEKRLLARVPVFSLLLARVAGRKLKKTFGGSIRVFAVGGAAIAPDVERFLRKAGFPYAIGYGLTETAPVVAGAPPARTYYRATGPALPGVRIRIADPRPDTGEGEVQVQGPNVMRGYYRDEERTREAFTNDGWFRTGDLGVLDSRGRLFIRGRLKTMILGASGENIYPEEIEALINQSPFVDDSLVYGDGTSVSALVQLKPDALAEFMSAVQDGVANAQAALAALLTRIQREVNSKLASFSRVHRVELQEEPFEKTPSQKIKRFLYPRRGTETAGSGGQDGRT